ncbi:MAG: hypothetical protein ACQESR_20795 [Planctomycetota bacterium]
MGRKLGFLVITLEKLYADQLGNAVFLMVAGKANVDGLRPPPNPVVGNASKELMTATATSRQPFGDEWKPLGLVRFCVNHGMN